MCKCKYCNAEMKEIVSVASSLAVYYCTKCGTLALKKYPFAYNKVDEWHHTETIEAEIRKEEEGVEEDINTVKNPN